MRSLVSDASMTVVAVLSGITRHFNHLLFPGACFATKFFQPIMASPVADNTETNSPPSNQSIISPELVLTAVNVDWCWECNTED